MTAPTDLVHRHLSQRVKELERLALRHAKYALALADALDFVLLTEGQNEEARRQAHAAIVAYRSAQRDGCQTQENG